MIGRLYDYFGVVGFASIAAWLAALLLFVIFARGERRTRFYVIACGLAVLGLLLAKWNSHLINQIEVDRSEQIKAAAARLQALREKARPKPRSHAADIRFVEDAPEDVLDAAGVEKIPTPTTVPAYRLRGKQKRTAGKQRVDEDVLALTSAPNAAGGRKLKEAQLAEADRCDRLNLFAARIMLWLACALVVVDYLSRFNTTLRAVWPLPIAGRIVDSLFEKTHVIHLRTANARSMRPYLERAVRKGESFIYLGPEDPLQEARLFRISLGKVMVWPVDVIRCGADGPAPDSRFILESAWFGRYCFVVLDPQTCTALLAELTGRLRTRHIPRAAAWRTVHLVWGFEDPPPELEELAFLCKEANLKLVVASRAAPADNVRDLFEERLALDPAG